MAPLDGDIWLHEVTADDPAGPNLEFDPDFGALERAAQGKAEQQYGATIIPAEDPDWKSVDALATALLERTRDLRILGHLALAKLHLSGLPAYAQIVTVIRQLLDTRWETVHPQLDPEDDNDPTLRANALLRLGEPLRVLRVLKDLPLASSLRTGRVAWRDVAILNGALEPEEGRPKLSEAGIRGIFAETDQGRLAAMRAALASLVADTVAIPAAFDRHAGPATGPDLTELTKLLRELQRVTDRYAPATDAPPEEVPVMEEAPAVAEAFTPAPVRGAVTAASLGPVTSRADALLLLDLVVTYYERYEPSSPLPLLIGRARRLADKDFMDILQDLAPDGLNQARNIAGAGT
jgi:type VI secretion system protein ImpA